MDTFLISLASLLESVDITTIFLIITIYMWNKDRERWAGIIENNTKAINSLVKKLGKENKDEFE